MTQTNTKEVSMNFFEQIIWALDGKMPEPPMFGWFHLLTIGAIIVLTFLLCWRLRNCSKKTFNIIILVAWIVMVLFEIYKQLNYSFSWDGTNAVWDYQWYAFPFQLCSSPLFVFPFIFCGGGEERI